MEKNSTDQYFESTVLGHPSGLFVLFFTEMWERFSFYGMRSLLVLFFMASIIDGGWGWDQATASSLFGSYVGLVYLSTMLGGYFADKLIGYRWAVVIGALLMTLGHFSMAFETQFTIYLGLAFLVFGNGFFKPNMTSIISEMYKDRPNKKDGAYTIFYMGVNAGAFFGILLCGYLGEKVGWGYGFGLAGVFMFLGLVQFWLAQNIFGDIGLKPVKKDVEALAKNDTDKRVPFTPEQCAHIMRTFQEVEVVVQPSPIRAFSDDLYAQAGIRLQEDLTDCDILLGVKEVNIQDLIPNKKFITQGIIATRIS